MTPTNPIPTKQETLEPNVHALTVLVCQDCIDLKGEMCNNPQCVFCRRTIAEVQHYLDVMLLCPVVDGKRLILVGDAVTNEDTPRAADAGPRGDFQRRLYEECVTANWDPERKNTFAEEIAHLHEELSEAFRAFRRYKDFAIREVNGKLEGVPIEFADALIGMFYNAELYGFDLLDAIERKHRFNLGRDYVAEGRQLHTAATASPTGAESDGSMTPEQLKRAGLIAESRGIDLEVAQELVYLRDARALGHLDGLREAEKLSSLTGAIRERIKLAEAELKGTK